MERRGPKASILTFRQRSAAIWNETEDLGEHRELQDHEMKRKVSINVIPLDQILPYDIDAFELFIFLRNNQEKLQGSLLLDAIFSIFSRLALKGRGRWI